MQATKTKLLELQSIIGKMPLQACCILVLPEFGVQWKEVSRAVRHSRLPMQPSSVARVLCRHVGKSLPADELDDILGRLRIKLVATQSRTWHVIRLLEPTADDPAAARMHTLPRRVLAALRNGKNRGMRPEVMSVMLNDLIYLSIQLVSDTKCSSTLYVASVPGQPIALVSTAQPARLLQACTEGLGYASFQVAELHGKDIPSLLRIASPQCNAGADQLRETAYEPGPRALPNGIDYTHRAYDESYIDNVIGPDPPLLTDLNIKTTRNFFDRSRLNKTINLTLSLKSEDVAKSLRCWVVKGAISPTSDFFQIFHKIKSNRITYNRDSDSD